MIKIKIDRYIDYSFFHVKVKKIKNMQGTNAKNICVICGQCVARLITLLSVMFVIVFWHVFLILILISK
jgi:hypothetical protein